MQHGFLAPTGRFAAGANDNVGSGYWTHTLSAGQTLHLLRDRRLTLSAFEIYEMQTLDDAWNSQDLSTFEKRHKPDVVVTWPGKPPTHGITAHNQEAVDFFKAEIAPTGKKIEVDFCAVARWDENGQIIEENLFYDPVSFMQQIGLGA